MNFQKTSYRESILAYQGPINRQSDQTIAKALRIAETEEATYKQIEAIRVPLEDSLKSGSRVTKKKMEHKEILTARCRR